MTWASSEAWDSLMPLLKPLSPAELARLGELLSRPIVDPPFHGEIGDCWSVSGEEQQ